MGAPVAPSPAHQKSALLVYNGTVGGRVWRCRARMTSISDMEYVMPSLTVRTLTADELIIKIRLQHRSRPSCVAPAGAKGAKEDQPPPKKFPILM
jgi:hypothetical protein